MRGNDFWLDMNNGKEGKLVCVGKNGEREKMYWGGVGVYNWGIVKVMKKKREVKCGVMMDEVGRIYLGGVENVIGRGGRKKVGVVLGFEDLREVRGDYGEKEWKVIEKRVGNILRGEVVGERGKRVCEGLGKVVEEGEWVWMKGEDVWSWMKREVEWVMGGWKIGNVWEGRFVGGVGDNFGEKIEEKILDGEIVVEDGGVSGEEKR